MKKAFNMILLWLISKFFLIVYLSINQNDRQKVFKWLTTLAFVPQEYSIWRGHWNLHPQGYYFCFWIIENIISIAIKNTGFVIINIHGSDDVYTGPNQYYTLSYTCSNFQAGKHRCWDDNMPFHRIPHLHVQKL